MGFSFERRARSRKPRAGLRALLGRAPEPAEVWARLCRILPRMWKDADVEVSSGRITADLHPFAPRLRISITQTGDLCLRAELDGVGPAFADEAAARMAPVLEELDYVWAGPARRFEPDDAAGAAPATDLGAALLAWLADELRRGATRIGVPEGRTYLTASAVQTSLGPRDAAWRDAVIADPSAGRDAFAWWERRPGHVERSRALLAMWHEVVWREPVGKLELAVMERVDADLAAARKADPSLALPYAEWAAIVGYLGDAARARELAASATGAATIGYRRFDLVVEPADGWEMTLAGAFLCTHEEDAFWATDGQRSLDVRALETVEHDPVQLLAVAPPRHPVVAEHVDGARHARAEAYDEDDVHIVHGLVAVAPHVAIVTCKGKPADHDWALATWRSLRRVEGEVQGAGAATTRGDPDAAADTDLRAT